MMRSIWHRFLQIMSHEAAQWSVFALCVLHGAHFFFIAVAAWVLIELVRELRRLRDRRK